MTSKSYPNLLAEDLEGVVNWIKEVTRSREEDISESDKVKNDIETNAAVIHAAADITYSNATSGLVAANVQAAIDELDTNIEALPLNGNLAGGRLTLTSATSVTTTDVTAATTIYYAFHLHDKIPIYNGTSWTLSTFTELSNITSNSATGNAGPAAVGNNSNYDLFVWNNSGTITLTRGPLWTSDTARGTGAGTTELQRINGIWTNKVAITNGPAANQGTYVGTVRSNASAQINDSAALRHVWNFYNRVKRFMISALETADSWNYTIATYRQANANAASQLDFIVGMNEEMVTAIYSCLSESSGGANRNVGIGLDSTSANSAQIIYGVLGSGESGRGLPSSASYLGYPGLGRHYLTALEYSVATNTTTWYGDNGDAAHFQSGITGIING